MARKKKEKKVEGPPELPKRIYVRWGISTALKSNSVPIYWLETQRLLNDVSSDLKVGEYVLVQKGTTQTILEIEEED